MTSYRDETETTYIDAYDRGRQIRQTSSNSGHRLSLSTVRFYIMYMCVCLYVSICVIM